MNGRAGGHDIVDDGYVPGLNGLQQRKSIFDIFSPLFGG
jgi:hypothetical protein